MARHPQERRRYSGAQVAQGYLFGLLGALAAAVVGTGTLVTTLRSTRALCASSLTGGTEPYGTWTCPDGLGYLIPAGLVGGAAAMLALTAAAVLIGRHTGPATIRRMSHHVLCLALLIVMPVSVGALVVAMTSGPGRLGGGAAGIVLPAAPLLLSHLALRSGRRPLLVLLVAALAALVVVPPVVVVVLQDALLLPLVTLVSGCWALALGLRLWAAAVPASEPAAG
ncbi:MAG: hypothetical protein WCA46_07365 [Actinocatenispora sp.]